MAFAPEIDLAAVDALNSNNQYLDIPLIGNGLLRVVVPIDEPKGSTIQVLPPSEGGGGGAGDLASGTEAVAGGVQYQGRQAGLIKKGPPRIEVDGGILFHAGSYKLVPGQSFTVYAWENGGGTVRVTGSEALRRSVYRASSSCVPKMLVEYHCLLQSYRHQAMAATLAVQRMGPRVLICGGPGTGKHTAAATLGNLAARVGGWAPLVLDLSCDTQTLALPGSIAMASWDIPSTVDELTSNMMINALCTGSKTPFRSLDSILGASGSGKQEESSKTSKIVGYGQQQTTTTTNEPKLRPPPTGTISCVYKNACSNLIQQAMTRLKAQRGTVVGPSGMITVLPHLPRRTGAEYAISILEQMDATHVLCLGDDYLLAQIQQRYGTPNLLAAGREEELGLGSRDGKVYFQGPSGQPLLIESPSIGVGALKRTEKQIREEHRKRCFFYFHGGGNVSIDPRRISLPLTAFEGFYKFVEQLPQTSDASASPDAKVIVERIGADRLQAEGSDLICALYDLPRGSGEMMLLSTPVSTYIHLTKVDVADVEFLATIPESGLPIKPCVVLTDLTWLSN